MRRLSFCSIVLVLISVCTFWQSFCQIKSEREKLLLDRDGFVDNSVKFGYGARKVGESSFSINETHLLKGNVKVDWVRHYFKTPSLGICKPTAIAVDDSGNILLTGNCQGQSIVIPGWDIVTIKYNSNGEKLWIVQYDSSLFPYVNRHQSLW